MQHERGRNGKSSNGGKRHHYWPQTELALLQYYFLHLSVASMAACLMSVF